MTTFDQNYYPDNVEGHIPLGETIQRYGILFWSPGDRFDYSNLDYGILGEVVDRVSGRSFADYLRDEVFLPLGLTRTSLGGVGLEKYAAKGMARTIFFIRASNPQLPAHPLFTLAPMIWRALACFI